MVEQVSRSVGTGSLQTTGYPVSQQQTQESPAKKERLCLENIPRPPNYKTRPCRLYHSERGGCTRGEFCHFIHDPKYAGKELPSEYWKSRKRPLSELPSCPPYPPGSMGIGTLPPPLYPYIPYPGIGSPPPTTIFHFPPPYLPHPNLSMPYIPRMPPH